MEFDYEFGDFEPAAPVARVVIRGPGDTACGDVPLLIDTGSDVSVVPAFAVEAVGGAIVPSHLRIEFLAGNARQFDEVELRVDFGRYRFSGQFLVADASHGILGRNILNLLVMTLDGPGLRWSV